MDSDHIRIDDIERLCHGITEPEKRGSILDHLAACEECRLRLLAMQRFLSLVKAREIGGRQP